MTAIRSSTSSVPCSSAESLRGEPRRHQGGKTVQSSEQSVNTRDTRHQEYSGILRSAVEYASSRVLVGRQEHGSASRAASRLSQRTSSSDEQEEQVQANA